jgi:hypothetical protein
MEGLALTQPQRVPVNRSELRQNQRATLRKATGRTVLVVSASDEGEEKIVADKEYFEEVLRKLRVLKETLEITMDERLFSRIMAAAGTLDEDIRLGKLHSFEEAFGQEEEED